GTIWGFRKSPLDPPDAEQPLQDYLAESPNGTSIVTNANGQYTPTPGVPLNKMLIGPFARIVNEAGSPLVPRTSGNSPSYEASGEQEVAQVSAFYWVNVAHEYVKPFLPGTPSRLVSNEIHVNINDTCNAFWSSDDNTLNFFKSGGGCVNSAFCDVVCHEF